MLAWTEEREPAHAVALVRIAYGGALATHLASLAFSDTWRWVWLPVRHGGVGSVLPSPVDWLGGPNPGIVGGVLLGTTLAALGMMVGFATPLMIALTAVGWASLTQLGAHAGGAYDFLAASVLWPLLFAGSGRALSVDAWLRRAQPPALAPSWARWLLVWQLVLMYSTTVWQKVSAGWVPGGPADALWYIFQQPSWQRMDMAWLAPFYPLTQAATLGSWTFEHASVLLVLAAWFRRTRTQAGWLRAQFNRIDVRLPWVLAGVVLHLGVELTMEVGAFTPLTLGLYPVLFAGGEVQAALSRLHALRRADRP